MFAVTFNTRGVPINFVLAAVYVLANFVSSFYSDKNVLELQ